MNKGLALAMLLAVGAASFLRCAWLGARPMHNDEAVNALKLGAMYEHGSFKYDPNEHHGPTLFYSALAFEKLTAAPDFQHLSEARVRLVVVCFGVGLLLLLPLLQDGVGRQAVGWGALFTAVSPALVYYSRDFIHETLLVLFAALALCSGWRYWRSRRLAWALLAGAAVGLMQATKETFLINVVAAGFALGFNQLWNRLLDASGQPIKAARLNWTHAAAGFAVWIAIALVLFSSFFTNASGPVDSLRTYAPWFGRAEGNSPHNHPWSFYFHRLLFFHVAKGPVWSEGLVLALALVAAVAAFLRKGLGDTNASFCRFLVFYSGALMVAYTGISYKTSWCLLTFWQPVILLAGTGASLLVRVARFQWARLAMSGLLVGGAAQLAAQAWQSSITFAADQRNPYVYAQTLPDCLRLVATVDSVAKSGEKNRSLLKVMAPQGDYWPLPWYLRSYSRVGWWDRVPENPYAPMMIVSSSFHAGLDDNKTHVMVGYFELRPGVFLELYVELKLWQRYLAAKEN